MILLNLFLVLSTIYLADSQDPWYRGCYHGKVENVTIATINGGAVVECAQYCHQHKFSWIAINKGSNCVCINASADLTSLTPDESGCTNRCIGDIGDIGLPCGGPGGAWSIYEADGPYIQNVKALVESNWIVIGQPVVLDAYIDLASSANISIELSGYKWLRTINVTWVIGDRILYKNETTDEVGLRLRSRLIHPFTDVGFYSFEVIAKNHISIATTTFNISVVDPAPRDIQVVLRSPNDHLPSCIPLEHGIVPTGPRLVVFQDETVVLEFSVAVGTNLTFTIRFGDTGEVISETPDVVENQCDGTEGDCMALIKDRIFSNVGVFPLQAVVSNQYGKRDKTITVVVMEAYLGQVSFMLEEETDVFETGSPIRFIVSLETTLRQTTVMQIDFGNGDVRNVSLKEHDEDEASNHLDSLSLITSYGEGCNLTVEFQYTYRYQGVYRSSVIFNEMPESLVDLQQHVTILDRLAGAKILAPKTTAVNNSTEFSIHFVKSSFNMSVLWTIALSNGKILDQMETALPKMVYTFITEGTFVLNASISNTINTVYASANVLVQTPISDITMDCEPKDFIDISSEVFCYATIIHGSSVSFNWDFNDRNRRPSVDDAIFGSRARHMFSEPGEYEVQVTATNSLNSVRKILHGNIFVEYPIRQVMLIDGSPTELGNDTDFFVKTNIKTNVFYDFDFGNGRRQPDGIAHTGDVAMHYKYIFSRAGKYLVRVYAYNNISEVNSSVTVYIEEPIKFHKAVVLPPVVAHLTTIFILNLKGRISDREDLIYEWKVNELQSICTKSPVLEMKYTLPGKHNLNYTIRNQVATVAGQLEFEIENSLSTPKVIHSAIVAVGKEVNFKLVGVQVWRRVSVDYSDGDKEVYRSPTKSWKHTFSAAGSYRLVFTIFGKKRKRTTVRSFINIQEPIIGLYLAGPTAVEIRRLHHVDVWRCVTRQGTHVLYTWSVDNQTEEETTVDQVQGNFYNPDTHVIQVRARNDISEAKASMKVMVQYPIEDVTLEMSGAIVGLLTNITLRVSGGRKFFIEYDFGDGNQHFISSEGPKLQIATLESGNGRATPPIYELTVSNRYETIGHYNVNFNVSNLVSYVTKQITLMAEEPIEGIVLMTDSPRVISLSNPVVTVRATVRSGKDLKFKWSFGDEYHIDVTSHGNTSEATHRYNVANEYQVKLNVTNPRYPHPVTAQLPFKFLVVDVIEDVFLSHDPRGHEKQNGAALRWINGQLTTDDVYFQASVVSGSHMTYIFDFGDGTTYVENVTSVNTPMTSMKKVKHRYKQIGIYDVKLTVINPLGNVMAPLNGPFYVQVAPEGVRLFDKCTRPREEEVYFVEIKNGTNITIDWKMGDETEFIDRGKSVRHQYQTTGSKTIEVKVSNKVGVVRAFATVSVVDEIQGVTLHVPSKSLVTEKVYEFRATPIPSIPGIVRNYEWDFGETYYQPRFHVTKDPVIEKLLPSGRHVITVKAVNCNSTVVSRPVEVHVMAKLKHIFISSTDNKLVNKPIEFWEKSWEGDFLNFTWNFGDGSEPVVQQASNVTHVYNRTGEYIVSLTAQNPISSKTVKQRIFILNKICNPPDVMIISQLRTADQQLSFLRSEVIYIEARVRVNLCHLSSVVRYSWALINSSNNNQFVLSNLDNHLNQLSLILPAATLSYGNYTAKLKVMMNGTIVYSVLETKFIVKPSPLLVVIDGGSSRRLNHKDILHLDGSLSTDPDRLEQKELRFSWSCQILNTLNESCFENTTWPSGVPNNVSVVAMPTRLLRQEKTDFLFNLTVMTPTGRTGVTDQVIEILRSDNVLSLNVKCKQCIGHLVNPNYQVSFETSCPRCQPTETTYSWEVKLIHNFDVPSSFDDLNECVKPDGSSFNVNLASKRLGTTPKPRLETISSQSTASSRQTPTVSTTRVPMMPWSVNEGLPVRGSHQPFSRGGGGHSDKDPRQKAMMSEGRGMSTSDINEEMTEGRLTPMENIPLPRRIPGRQRESEIPFNIGEGSPGENELPFNIGEGSPGESGSSQGRINGVGSSMNHPREGVVCGRHCLSQGQDEQTQTLPRTIDDTFEGPASPRPQVQHVITQISDTIRLLSEQTRTGLDKQSLVIKPGVLKQGHTYVVKVTAHTTENESGVAMAYFKINESPKKGLCDYKVINETERSYRVNCWAWQDMHLPIEYEVSYNLEKDEMKKVLYLGLNHEINFKLPVAEKVFLYIGVVDSQGARTSVCPIVIKYRRSLGSRNNLTPIQLQNELQKSVEEGDSRAACIIIDNLANFLNQFNTSDVETRQQTRLKMLEQLRTFPKRNKVEILQVAQSLVSTTAVPKELNPKSLLKVFNVLMSLKKETEALYANQNAELHVPDLLTLAVHAASNIMQAVLHLLPYSTSKKGLKHVTDEALAFVDSLLKLELQHHCIGEQPIHRMAEYVSVMATHFNTGQRQVVKLDQAAFLLPPQIKAISDHSTNQQCYQAHMTSFKHSPYVYNNMESKKVQSQVVSLDIYSCEGRQPSIENLEDENRVEIWIPRSSSNEKNESSATTHTLKRDMMNIHQFNVTNENMELSLHITLDLNPVKYGRPFPIVVLIGQHRPPTPQNYTYKEEFDQTNNHVKIFLPSGSLSETGKYYLGVVDSGYNSGRRRPGELMERSYSLLLWWGGCLFWNNETEKWSSEGCSITKQSSFDVSHCRCNHLTAFGGPFDLIPNDLDFVDVEEFFGLNENPVVVIMVCVILCLYAGLMVVCYKADLHDARKSGLVYLKDNRPSDKHNYEITVETGYRHGAGTTSKISLILHGEEGMSETRELISDDGRTMFEQNSRDIFIMTLPESLGRLWKVQLWHNNEGVSPGWYLSRVIIKDLITGKMYYFLCEKWFAVEEDDGKVEREIMVLDSELGFSKVFWAKGSQYIADYHLWLSPYTCPSYSRFTRIERLTCCLTVLLSYMCLNAVWYQTKFEYRGEFRLLDLSLRNITVGVVCCCIILPINLFIAFLFRRSKISYPGPEPDKVYPSGKQYGEQISETDEESVQPVMTYSILDQSILNWQGIQDWAQKQWLKRQQSLRSNADSVKSRPNPQQRSQTGESERDPNSPTTELTSTTINGPISPLDSPVFHQTSGTTTHNPLNILSSTLLSSSPQSSPPSPRHLPPNSWNFSQGPLYGPRYLPTSNTVNGRNLSTNHDLPVLHVPVLQNVRRGYETDQASSGFVDATSQSQATAERTRIKLVSETSSSSRQSNTEYVDNGRGWRLFLPFWCRYIAWSLCIMIITTCTVVTILYGFRFGYSKSIMWLQSLYFSFMICVFITQPLMILIIVMYTAITYRNDPSILNHHDDGYYGVRYDGKKKMEEKKNESPSEELERGVAARQRSRYLRFARPPQEKTLIEARKKRIKEKLAYSLFRNCVVQLLLVSCVCFMAYGKDSTAIYNLNTALHKIFLQSGNQSFHSIKTIPEFYTWCQSSLLDNLHDIKTSTTRPEGSYGLRNSYLIGSANLRQLRVRQEPCLSEFAIPLRIMPGVYECHYSYTQRHKSSKSFGPNDIWTWQPAQGGATLWGKYGFYDNSGFVTELNDSRNIASEQIKELEILKWLDRQTRAVVVEFTIYYVPDNLFTCVSLLVEFPSSGGVFTRPFISSTYLFRYVSTMDKFILAFELLFIVISLHKVKCQLVAMVKEKKKYFTSFWNMIELLMCIVSMVYIGCYIYRYILVSEVVEYFRNTYYQQFINISFICCWNELLQALVGFVLFLLCVNSVRLLNHNSWCIKAVSFYRRSQRELLLFTLLFGVMVMAYSSAGVALFGTACEGLMGVWSGIFTMVMALTGVYPESDINQSEWTNLFMFTYLVFATGLLSAYVLAVLSRRVKSGKTLEMLQMGVADCLSFLWDKFLINTGIRKTQQKQEPENILPAEFIMAEIEYQVDELLFRMNALSGSSALPDKPRTYFTDSDATQHIVGDDGISTGGSEHDHMLVEGDRLEHRVQRIEDKLCANEPYLAQLLKLDSVGADVLSQEKEKQLRSHLELEIFRQLQLQRQESNDLTDGPLLLTTDNSGHNTEQSNTLSTGESNNQQDTTWLAGGITGLENLLKLQESLPESSSSSPDSTHDNRGNKQQTHSKQRPLIQLKGCIKTALLEAKNTKRSSSSDNVSPQSSESDKAHARTDSSSGQSSNTGSLTKNTPAVPGRKQSDKPPLKTASSKTNSPSHGAISAKPFPKIKPAIPPKPSFMRGSLAELKSSKNSPNLRKLRLAPDRCSVKEAASGHVGESSSGSEQDGSHALKVPAGKRALRKTRSQGRGKGHGEIVSAHILGDLETDVFGEEEEEDIDDETQK